VIRPLAASVFAVTIAMAPLRGDARQISAAGVRALNPTGAITPTGTWSLATRAGVCVGSTCYSPVKR
jgi:hypothetical protein